MKKVEKKVKQKMQEFSWEAVERNLLIQTLKADCILLKNMNFPGANR